MDERPLNHKQSLFVEYLLADVDLRAGAAYQRAYGCSLSAANTGASKLMDDPRVIALVEKAKAERLLQAGLTKGEILAELRAIVTADPRDLIEFRRGACRYCYGAGFLFHRTPAEYRRDLADYQKNDEAKPADKRDPMGLKFPVEGGVGFNPTKAPNPECPECFGAGQGYSYAKDSRNVPLAAARLYAGVKETKDGLEIKTRSVDKSVELLMRHAGMLSDGDKGREGTPEEKAAKVRELVAALDATTGTSSNGST